MYNSKVIAFTLFQFAICQLNIKLCIYKCTYWYILTVHYRIRLLMTQ